MNVVVTGASGFIGAALVQRLSAREEVRLVPVTRAQVDLAVPGAFAALLADTRPQAVVHLAASTNRSESPEGQLAQWRDTFQATREVFEACAAAKVPHLLAAGSITELGDHNGVLGPDLPARPFGTYGLCKALALEVARFHARRSGMRVDWFRPFTVYGPGQQGTMLIPAAMQCGKSRQPADFTDGLQERDFLYIDDLVDWLERGVLRRPAADGTVQVHHLGSGIPTRVRDVLLAIQAEFPGAVFRLGARPRFPGEPAIQVAPLGDVRGAVLEAWQPSVAWKDGIARTAAWWRDRGD